jgi:hypothetical protein
MCTAYNEQVLWEGIVLPVGVVWHEGRYCKKQEENRVTLGIIPTMAPTKQGKPYWPIITQMHLTIISTASLENYSQDV